LNPLLALLIEEQWQPVTAETERQHCNRKCCLFSSELFKFARTMNSDFTATAGNVDTKESIHY